MNRECTCQFSSTCRIYELNSASDRAEDADFLRNCCNGADRTYCPIYRYHQTVKHQAPPEVLNKEKEDFPFHLVT